MPNEHSISGDMAGLVVTPSQVLAPLLRGSLAKFSEETINPDSRA